MNVFVVALLMIMSGLLGYSLRRCRRPHAPFTPGDPFMCGNCCAPNTVGAPLLRCNTCRHEEPMNWV